MTELTKKDAAFEWTEKVESAFVHLKKQLVNAPILKLPNDNAEFILTTDASDFAVGAVLSQLGEEGLQPVAFESRKMIPAERNYAAHEKELLAILYALKKWRVYLEGRRFQIQTDHHSLRYLQTQPNLSRRQARWLETLQEFDFEITYLPGKENVVADALSRRPDLRINVITDVGIPEKTKNDIRQALTEDQEFDIVIRALSTDEPNTISKSYLEHFELQEGLLYYDGKRLCLPKGPLRTDILYDHHDAAIAGHQGVERTYESIQRYYYWPKMSIDIRKYVLSCDSCQRIKASQQRPAGLLQPMPTPTSNWESISMDFITHLPATKDGKDTIVVFVDMLSKMAHFVAARSTDTAPEVARLLFENVFRLHRLPKRIVSDRDSKFTSRFWRALFDNLGTKLAMSTAFHPQTDGQTERANRTLEDMLRAYIGYRQNDWDRKLTAAEFVYNSASNASTKLSPFQMNYGKDPPTPSSFLTPDEKVLATNEFLTTMDNLTNRAKDNLALAKKRQEETANRLRRDVEFEPGDKVLLSAANLMLESQATQPSKKLQPRFIGPYTITKKVSPVAYQLDLPPTLRIHPTFHVSCLKGYEEPSNVPFREGPIEPPPATSINDQDEYEVEQILDERTHRRRKEYLVWWKGYPLYDSTWELAGNLENAAEAIRTFERRESEESEMNPTRREAANSEESELRKGRENVEGHGGITRVT